jgi:hypothetical protein
MEQTKYVSVINSYYFIGQDSIPSLNQSVIKGDVFQNNYVQINLLLKGIVKNYLIHLSGKAQTPNHMLT